jgi:3',5'-cyclic AMP phosphodiesterase CpdA
MRWSRREFLALGALALTSCKRGVRALPLDKIGLGPGDGSNAAFTFAAINDLHITNAASAAIVGRAVQQINADPRVDFTVVIGDLATDGTFSELNVARSPLDSLSKPFYVVPGNHDVDMTTRDIYANYTRVFGPTQWVEHHRGWVLLGLDSCNGTASDVTIPPDRLLWLEKQLNRINASRPIALFVHHPFNPNTKAYRVQNADQVVDMFAGHNLKLVASGHFHGNQVEERDGILFTTTVCCSTTRGNHDGTEDKGYRLFHVDQGMVDTEFVVVPA